MRIVVLGANEFGYRAVENMMDWSWKPSGIFTIPRTFDISYEEDQVENVLHANFHDFEQPDLPVYDVEESFNTERNYERLKGLHPDLLLVMGWYYKVPRRFREIANKGAVGIHNSLLPKYRGGAPLVWAMINDESKAGTSLFYLEDDIDSGDVLEQRAVSIREEDSIKEVYKKANHEGMKILKRQLPLIERGDVNPTPQNEQDATRYPQRSPEDGLINWNWDARRIWNFIRAQTRPYPGAFGMYAGHKLRIWEAEIIRSESNKKRTPGLICECSEDSFVVETGEEDRIQAIDIEYEGSGELKKGNVIDGR